MNELTPENKKLMEMLLLSHERKLLKEAKKSEQVRLIHLNVASNLLLFIASYHALELTQDNLDELKKSGSDSLQKEWEEANGFDSP